MEDVVDLTFDGDVVRYIVADEIEVRISHQVGDVISVASDEVVNAHNCMAFFDESITQVRTKKTCPTGYH